MKVNPFLLMVGGVLLAGDFIRNPISLIITGLVIGLAVRSRHLRGR